MNSIITTAFYAGIRGLGASPSNKQSAETTISALLALPYRNCFWFSYNIIIYSAYGRIIKLKSVHFSVTKNLRAGKAILRVHIHAASRHAVGKHDPNVGQFFLLCDRTHDGIKEPDKSTQQIQQGKSSRRVIVTGFPFGSSYFTRIADAFFLENNPFIIL